MYKRKYITAQVRVTEREQGYVEEAMFFWPQWKLMEPSEINRLSTHGEIVFPQLVLTIGKRAMKRQHAQVPYPKNGNQYQKTQMEKNTGWWQGCRKKKNYNTDC